MSNNKKIENLIRDYEETRKQTEANMSPYEKHEYLKKQYYDSQRERAKEETEMCHIANSFVNGNVLTKEHMFRPLSKYLISITGTIEHAEYGKHEMIVSLKCPNTQAEFPMSELFIWKESRPLGHIKPLKVSSPFLGDASSYYNFARFRTTRKPQYYIDISELVCVPATGEPYPIVLPIAGWLLCEYEMAIRCKWQ